MARARTRLRDDLLLSVSYHHGNVWLLKIGLAVFPMFKIAPPWSRKAEFSHFGGQSCPLKPQAERRTTRSAHHPTSLTQRKQDVFTFGFHQGAGPISNLRILDGRGVGGAEKRFNWRVKNTILRKDHRPLNEVLQLPHVARPRMSGERINKVNRD